jgi:hypothetical protein
MQLDGCEIVLFTRHKKRKETCLLLLCFFTTLILMALATMSAFLTISSLQLQLLSPCDCFWSPNDDVMMSKMTSLQVVYGKTLGGGMPCGVVCGPSKLMNRNNPNLPLNVAYVIGTFSAAPLTVACMHQFLTWVLSKEVLMRTLTSTKPKEQKNFTFSPSIYSIGSFFFSRTHVLV